MIIGPVHPAYNPYFSACFFSRISIFLSQQINQQCFSASLSAQPNGAIESLLIKKQFANSFRRNFSLEDVV
jgi:hypothetical protein